MKKTYKGFLLDADNTLFDFSRSQREALEDTLQALAPAVSSPERFELFHRINAELWGAFERGAIALSQLRVVRFRRLFEALSVEEDPERAADLYVEALGAKAYLMPHARGVLEALASRSRLALISNGLACVQRARIGRAGIGGLFHQIIISEEEGLAKPDPRLFLIAVGRLGLERTEVLCVGDSPATDIRGAHLAGLDACWLEALGTRYPEEEPQPEYRISDLRELLEFAETNA